MSSPADKKRLLQRVSHEAVAAITNRFLLPVHMDLHVLMCVVGSLHLALRHPANTGPASQVVRDLLDGIIARVTAEGYIASAELMRLGDDPAYDEERT